MPRANRLPNVDGQLRGSVCCAQEQFLCQSDKGSVCLLIQTPAECQPATQTTFVSVSAFSRCCHSFLPMFVRIYSRFLSSLFPPHPLREFLSCNFCLPAVTKVLGISTIKAQKNKKKLIFTHHCRLTLSHCLTCSIFSSCIWYSEDDQMIHAQSLQ